MVRLIQNKEEWDALHAEAAANKQTVIVDFTATWCGPCRMIGPIFEQLAGQYPSLIFVKVDVDQAEPVASACGISAMPTFQVWEAGVKVDDLVGASKEKLEALVKVHAEKAAAAAAEKAKAAA